MFEYITAHPFIGSCIVTFGLFVGFTGVYIILRFASAAVFRSYFEAKHQSPQKKGDENG